MKIRAAVLLVAIVAICAIAIPKPASASPSPALGQALRALRNLSDVDFDKVIRWARNGTPQPTMALVFPDHKAEETILALNQPDRRAVLQWLRGNGRDALYDRGATDSDIGTRRPALGPTATPTPNPWRVLEFGSPTVGGESPSKIQILGGWAAVKRDGKAATVCVSFKNNGAVAATRVVINFSIVDDEGRPLAPDADKPLTSLTLDRRGTFSTGVDINGWSNLSDWQGGVGHRGYGDNCTTISTPIAALPLLAARFATYHILVVEHADGTIWTIAQP
jgi:hypothetical protein